MLKFLYILLFIGLSIGLDPQPDSRAPSSSLTGRFRINRVAEQYPPFSQNDGGGSVYSDGSGIHVHHQFPSHSIQYSSSPNSFEYTNGIPPEYTYDDYYGADLPGIHIESHLVSTDPYAEYGNVNYDPYNFPYNAPGISPQNMVPGLPYLPSNSNPMTGLNGLGRVLPLNYDPYLNYDRYDQNIQETHLPSVNGLGRVPRRSNDRTNQELLMFTLGRVLGQDDAGKTDKLLDFLLGRQMGPSNQPWGRWPSNDIWEPFNDPLGNDFWGQPNPFGQSPFGQSPFGQSPFGQSNDLFGNYLFGGNRAKNLWGSPYQMWGQPWGPNNYNNLWGPQPNTPQWFDLLFDTNEPEQDPKPWWYNIISNSNED